MTDATWQPIETAPRDGTWILLSGGEVGDHWYGDNDVPPPSMVVGRADGVEGEWVFDNWDGAFRSTYDNPTKWMPLP